MPARRRRDGFHLAGELELSGLELPRAKARELLLARAWRKAAGEAVSQRVIAREGRGGVLTLRVEDERWATVLVELLPRLAARLAAECPELRVHRFKIEGGPAGSRAQPLPAWAPDSEGTTAAAPPAAAGEAPLAPLAERLEAVVGNYLARQKP